VLSFVCSVGNIPLAAVLWNGGISFGGVIAFIYADLIVLPIINIYRKYYGWKATAFVVGIFYLAMATAAVIIESVFRILGLVSQERKAQFVEASISFNYTTVLNIISLLVAGFLVIRFLKTGGPKMLAHGLMSAGESQKPAMATHLGVKIKTMITPGITKPI
jgi:uncharacterized membrane protein YraQ (UPF0718 family)